MNESDTEFTQKLVASALVCSKPALAHGFFRRGTLGDTGVVYGVMRYTEQLGAWSGIYFLAAMCYRGWEFTLETNDTSHTTCYGAFHGNMHYTFAGIGTEVSDDADPLELLGAWLQTKGWIPEGGRAVIPDTGDALQASLEAERTFRPPFKALLNDALRMGNLSLTAGYMALMVFPDENAMLHWYEQRPGPGPDVRFARLPFEVLRDHTPGLTMGNAKASDAWIGVAYSQLEDYSDCTLKYWASFCAK